MSETPPDFAALLQRARGGDEAAFAQLAREYESEIRVVARVRLGPALRPYLDSIDVVQSVHRTLLHGLRHDRFDLSRPEQLLRLALTLVRRKVARQWRRARRQQRLDRGAADDSDLCQQLSALSSPQPGPAQSAQLNDQLQHVLLNLTPAERQVLELRLQGYNTAEVARELRLNAAVLRAQLTRLRRRLRALGVLAECL